MRVLCRLSSSLLCFFWCLTLLDLLKAMCTVVVVDVGVGKRGEKHKILINEHLRGRINKETFAFRDIESSEHELESFEFLLLFSLGSVCSSM